MRSLGKHEENLNEENLNEENLNEENLYKDTISIKLNYFF